MMGLSWLVTLGGFGGASLAFLWPDLRGGFGAELTLPLDEEGLLETIRSQRQPFEFAPGRAYIVEYSEDLDADGQYAEITNGARVMALYWRCVHLGCKVPWCQSSQWLECPCHGSRYNRWGEWQAGPAARGLDRFPVRVENGEVVVNTGEIVTGPSRQTPSLDQPPEGPSCL
jgi:cytochrome b6-f complex iron-sulfur subunit